MFGQWFHYYHLDGPDVKVEVNTFLAVFPHASLWLVPPVVAEDGTKKFGADLLLVGSREPHALDWTRLETTLGETPVGEDLRAAHAVRDPLALVASWAMGRREMRSWVRDEEAFPSGTPLNTDDHPYIEFVAPRRNVVAPVEAARAASARLADISRAAGDARDAVRGLLAEDAGADEVAALHRELARRHAAAGQPERALAALEAAVAALPGDAAARTQAAGLLLGQGREAEALARLRVAVRLDANNLKAWDLLGQIAIDRQDYPLAEEAHRAMLRREPSHVNAWLRLGAVLARQEKWGEAREALRWAKQLDPEAPVDPELERYIEERAERAASPAGS